MNIKEVIKYNQPFGFSFFMNNFGFF